MESWEESKQNMRCVSYGANKIEKLWFLLVKYENAIWTSLELVIRISMLVNAWR